MEQISTQTSSDEGGWRPASHGSVAEARTQTHAATWPAIGASIGWLLFAAVTGPTLWLTAVIVSSTFLEDSLASLAVNLQKAIFVAMLVILPAAPGVTAAALHLSRGRRWIGAATVAGTLAGFALTWAIYSHA